MNTSPEPETAEFQIEGHSAPQQLVPGVRVTADLGGVSHPGKVRPNNEDHFLVARYGRFLAVELSNLPPDALCAVSEEGGFGLVVADGIGGSQAGEEASRLAVAGLMRFVQETPDWILRLDDEPLPQEVMRRTTERYSRVGELLADEATADPDLRGYGTTLTVAFSLGRELFVGHVGDSRAYLFRQGKLTPLTRDHTVAQALLDRQHIRREELATHRMRNVLTRSMGDHGRPVEPDVSRVLLEDGDGLLVCTDGLTDMVSDSDITTVLNNQAASAQEVCQKLVDMANAAGGKDNVTVAFARYQFD